MSIYGKLDTANECVKRVSEALWLDWSEAKVRMRKEDISRARDYLRSINKEVKKSSDALKKFEGIVLLEVSGTMKPLATKNEQ